MVYSNKFVMCVLLNGVPVQEAANGQVALPFGAEFGLRFRNKHNRRAMVKIYIDGENVSGGGYIVNANDYGDIIRHHDFDRAFKFVALDSPDAVEHGKNGPNPDKVKGTIEARFWLEKERPVYRPTVVEHHHHYYKKEKQDPPKPWNPYPWSPQPIWTNTDMGKSGTTYRGMSGGGAQSGIHTSSMGFNENEMESAPRATWNANPDISSLGIPDKIECSAAPASFAFVAPASPPVLQEGCTVEGGSTGQSFRTVSFEAEADYVSLKVFLVGYVSDKPLPTATLEQPTTEETKHCTNCGAKKAKKKAKFCHNCGTKY